MKLMNFQRDGGKPIILLAASGDENWMVNRSILLGGRLFIVNQDRAKQHLGKSTSGQEFIRICNQNCDGLLEID